jgi:hypothetical protein
VCVFLSLIERFSCQSIDDPQRIKKEFSYEKIVPLALPPAQTHHIPNRPALLPAFLGDRLCFSKTGIFLRNLPLLHGGFFFLRNFIKKALFFLYLSNKCSYTMYEVMTMSMISPDSVEIFYRTYDSLVKDSLPLALFLSQITAKMDAENRDYFVIPAKKTGRKKDIYFQFERRNDELVFKGIHTRRKKDGVN